MNVNGRNAWKCGPFGAYILSMDVRHHHGEARTLARSEIRSSCAHSLGVWDYWHHKSITVQLQRDPSGYVTIRRRSAASLGEILTLFAEEEQTSDFMEAWLDGFASGRQLGRGHITVRQH